MRVLIVCGAGIVSGKEIMCLQLIRELKHRGVECYCITSSWGSSDFKDRLQSLNVPYRALRIGFISKTLTWDAIRMTLEQFLYLPGLFIRYRSIIRRENPEIVIHTNFHHLFLLYPVLGNRRNFYWSHEIISDQPFYRNLFRRFAKKVLLFISVSDAVAASLKALIDEKKVVTIKNGIDEPACLPRMAGANNVMTIAIAGQVAPHKGHDLLLQALSNLLPGQFLVKIIGSGDPLYVTQLKSLAESLNLTPYIAWTGFIKDTNMIYEGVDAMIVPTRTPDPYPTIVIEAAMRGIPSIGSNIGGLPEMIEHGVTGFLFQAGDADDLCAMIKKMADRKTNQPMYDDVLRFAKRNFGLDRFVDEFEKVIKQSN